jgi:fructokinase
MDPIYGGIEAGGTKFSCAVGRRTGEILAYEEITTTNPEETLKKVIDFFKAQPAVVSIGVGSFGPIDLDSSSNTYGHITKTPKEGWSDTNIKGMLSEGLNRPIELETDVGCAGLGEYFYGAAKGINNILYLTIGTGIGGAILLNGRVQRGLSHPEMGHMLLRHDFKDDPFEGLCPFHKDCFEGLASGPAIEARVGAKAEHVIDPVRWDLEAHYIALALTNLITILSPKIIVLGGGVIKHGGLLHEVSALAEHRINGYMALPMITTASDMNAVRGAIRLAAQGVN